MNEAVIFQSPHAIKPEVFLTEAEREERYRTRLDETFCPYTVLDVLTRVYRHRPEDDLCAAFGKNPGAFASLEEGSSVSRAWVTGCRIVRVETLFFQPLQDFLVELYVQAVMRMEIVRSGQPGVKHTKTVRRDLRLQYRFDLRPCKLTCQFTGVILNEADSLLALNPEAIRADKYLLPILREEDYPYLADMLLSMDGIPKGALLDAEALVKGMGLKLFQGVFPENGVMGEIYFNFGMARIVDPDTGEIREAKIRPGTVLINRSACINRGMYNGTLLHEGSHFLLALKHFLLQMTHGHQYCSYLCKRRGQRRQRERLTPVDIMEIQANKLPGYLMIDEESGRKKAEELIRSYPRLDIKNTAEFVREMAEYFGTTQTLARTRLETMGYQAVRGILRTANGRIVPAYFSDLKDNQTYIIDHSDALKEYIANREFRAVLDSGQYIYCEGHFCLKQPQYVKIDHVGHPHLTVYAREHIHARLGLEKGKYILLSAHREENIDTEKNFISLFTAINRMAEKYDMPILYSCHPRSRKRLEQSGFQLDKRVIQHEPLGFHDYNCLQMNAFCVVSDSGTLPEESSFFTSVGHPFPAVCIRTSTERPEALDKGCFILAGIDEKSLLQAVDTAVEMNQNGNYGIPVPDYVDENVSDKVVKIIQSYTGVVNKMVWRKG